MIKIIREIKRFESCSKGWGYAYKIGDRDVIIAAPIPFNLILSWLRVVYLCLKYNDTGIRHFKGSRKTYRLFG